MDSENVYASPETQGSNTPPPKKKPTVKTRLVELAVVLLVIFVLLAMLGPFSRRGVRGAARRVQCLNNLRQIVLATHSYENVNGHLPPAYIADDDGKPMHSWRVLLLPYLEEKALFDRYDMDEPWDGPNNSKLHDEVVSLYHCPSSDADPKYTDYVLITGEGTAFDGDQTIKFGDIADGLSKTIMATEIKDSKIHWMRPMDISPEEFLAVESTDDEMATNHPGIRNVALFDNSTHNISNDVDPAELKKMTTINGGEPVNVKEL